MKVKCIKRVPIGLFAIDVGTIWRLAEVEYNEIPQKAKVKIIEQNEENMSAKISQSILFECFELA